MIKYALSSDTCVLDIQLSFRFGCSSVNINPSNEYFWTHCAISFLHWISEL